MFTTSIAQAPVIGKALPVTALQRDAALADFVSDFMRRTLPDATPERQARHAAETLANWGEADRWELYRAMELGA
ncbi:MAG: hypothetical protein IT330_17340 [Anaerolineae bacterium]|nr:hypothetical protein [Anaerolineae bacterium]